MVRSMTEMFLDAVLGVYFRRKMATLRSEDDEPLALKTAQTADGPYSLKNTLTVSSPASVIEPHGPESPSSAAEGTQPSTRGGLQNQNDSVMLESTNELVRGPFVDSLMEDHGADLIPAKDGTTPNDAGSDLCQPMKGYSTNQKTDLVACPKCTGLASGIHECLRNIQLLNDRLYAYQQRLRMSDHEQKHGDDVSKQHLQDLLDSANAENANLRSQLNDLLNRFKDAKIKADRRAELLHHVMSEYNAMEKEYELMKTASTSIQKKNEMLQQQVSMQEESLYQLERSVQLLETENNELRRSRIIDANTKTWYGKCTHSCATHPRTYPYAYSTRHKDIKQGDAETEDQEARCEICAEAEKWAEGIIQKPAYWSESLRRHNEATLPLRGQDAKPGRETLESTTEHTIFTMPSAPPQEQKQQQQQPSTGGFGSTIGPY
ncbi:hypothetical protein AAHC03_09797 [Spirometra sp. Aus1]